MNKVLRKILGTSVAVLTVASVTLVANTGFAADVELWASHQWNTKDVRHAILAKMAPLNRRNPLFSKGGELYSALATNEKAKCVFC